MRLLGASLSGTPTVKLAYAPVTRPGRGTRPAARAASVAVATTTSDYLVADRDAEPAAGNLHWQYQRLRVGSFGNSNGFRVHCHWQ
jgi:hypothetical protein